MLAKMKKDKLDRTCVKFCTVHALAKHHHPYTDFVWQNQLDRLKGLDVGSERDKAAAIFAHHIGEVSKVDIFQLFFLCNLFALDLLKDHTSYVF